MAVYINGIKTGYDKNHAGGGRIVDYTVDFEADIANLPVGPEIAQSSSALVISTGNVYIYGINGWARLGG